MKIHFWNVANIGDRMKEFFDELERKVENEKTAISAGAIFG